MSLSWTSSDWHHVGVSLGVCLAAAVLILVGYIIGHR